jgi:hypothetical protein
LRDRSLQRSNRLAQKKQYQAPDYCVEPLIRVKAGDIGFLKARVGDTERSRAPARRLHG